MPPELAERLGITKYLAPLPREIDGTRKPGLRVRAARLRGEPSYGTIDHAVDPAWEVGRDVKDHYGVTKFEPPVRPDRRGRPAAPGGLPRLHRHREHPQLPRRAPARRGGRHHREAPRQELPAGADPGARRGGDTFEFMAGSNDVRRKEVDSKGRPSDFWRPMTEAVRDLLRLPIGGDLTFLFGRTLRQRRAGHGLRARQRGQGVPGLRLAVDGKYLGFDEKAALFARFGSRRSRTSTGVRSRGRRSRSTPTARRPSARPMRPVGSGAGRGASSRRSSSGTTPIWAARAG